MNEKAVSLSDDAASKKDESRSGSDSEETQTKTQETLETLMDADLMLPIFKLFEKNANGLLKFFKEGHLMLEHYCSQKDRLNITREKKRSQVGKKQNSKIKQAPK